jgi:hypothetical protein
VKFEIAKKNLEATQQVWEESWKATDVTNAEYRDQYANDSRHDGYSASGGVRYVSLGYYTWPGEHFLPSRNFDVSPPNFIDLPTIEIRVSKGREKHLEDREYAPIQKCEEGKELAE